MSKFNESPSHNKEEKTSKIIIISKERVESAKNKVNFLTLKEGELKLTVQLNNDSLNKNSINKAVKSIKQTMLINSKSFVSLHDQSKKNNYLKKKNILQTPSIKKEKNSRKSPYLKKNDNVNVETLRNLMKTTENNNYDTEDNNINKLETVIPVEYNTEENYKFENKEKNIDDDNRINNIETLEIETNNNNAKNDNNKNNAIIGGFVSRDYFNNTKDITKDKNDNTYDIHKSEEIKQLNSDKNAAKNNINIIKSNNFIDKNNQQSDRAAKSISEQEQDYKQKVSKLVLDSLKINETETIKENNKGIRLITEYDEQNNKNEEKDLISESKSKSSKTIKVDENDEESEKEEVNIQNNNNQNNKINNKEKNETFLKIKDEFDNKKKKENSNNLKPFNTLQARNLNTINYIYKTCSICEHALPISKLFVAECQQHFLCRKCAKNYYEDIIENGSKEMLCPFIKCGQPVDLESLEGIISKEHYNILVNNTKNIGHSHTKFYNTKLKTSYDQENLQLYTKKHVLDINTNKSFFEYNNIKDVYCPNCYTDSLFSKTNTNFFKCLYCECKRCKYCLKDYDTRHMDTVSPDHCKVYYRFDEEEMKDSKKIFYLYFLQLFFVLATYYLCFVGAFLFLRKLSYYMLCIKTGSNIFLYIVAYLLTIILFLISVPFILFFYPYFPSILAFSDY